MCCHRCNKNLQELTCLHALPKVCPENIYTNNQDKRRHYVDIQEIKNLSPLHLLEKKFRINEYDTDKTTIQTNTLIVHCYLTRIEFI